MTITISSLSIMLCRSGIVNDLHALIYHLRADQVVLPEVDHMHHEAPAKGHAGTEVGCICRHKAQAGAGDVSICIDRIAAQVDVPVHHELPLWSGQVLAHLQLGLEVHLQPKGLAWCAATGQCVAFSGPWPAQMLVVEMSPGCLSCQSTQISTMAHVYAACTRQQPLSSWGMSNRPAPS